MTLSLAGQTLSDMSGLSEAARLCLNFVDGGTQWLRWAIARPGASYAFDDEAALVQGVQQGLHGTALTLLPALGLTVAPSRLMALAPAELKTLAKAEAGGVLKPGVRKLLADNHLLTAADLEVGTAWLVGQGVADAPVFQALNLPDRIALADLAEADRATPALGQEASAFAVAEARAPAEFADYRRLYLALAARPGTGSAAERQALARQCLDILLPWMFTALDCPAVVMPATADTVSEGLQQWLDGGRFLGFSRAAAGARQICERTDFMLETTEVGELIAGYLRDASGVLGPAALTVTPGQDGQSMTGAALARDGEARLVLNALGHLSLDDFQPAAQSVETSS